MRIQTYCGVALPLLAVVMSCCLGCGGNGLPDTISAGGTVTYKGEPLAGANVIFRVQGGRAAHGTTDEEGRFRLSTFGEHDGAIAGEHKVTVSKMTQPAVVEPSADPSQGETMEAAAEASASQDETAAPESVIPERYADPATSGLTFQVTADGANDFQIELTE